MRRSLIAAVVAVMLVGSTSGAVAAQVPDERSANMERLATWSEDGKYREGTDLAFWGDTAVLGKYGGMRLLDVSDRSNPRLIGSLACSGSQADVSVWKDLAFISVDSPMASPSCDAAAASHPDTTAGNAWEGIRIVDISDPRAPKQIDTVYTDCGSHTHTLVPDLQHRDWVTGEREPRVLLYSSSYPLTGQGTRCSYATQRKISVVEVPLNDPTAARVVSTPDVSPAIGCHDVTVFMPRKLAAAACITESQIWDISNPAHPVILSRIRNPRMQIHHSSAFSWDGDVLVLGDEKGGAAAASGCMANGQAPTGALWFYDISDPVRPAEKGWYVTPQNETSTMCTAHNFNVIPVRSDKRILVTSWYHGGTHVVDFTDPAAPKQVGYYKAKDGIRGNPWSSYWYNGAIFSNNFDAGYVPSVPQSRGFDVLRIDHPDVANTRRLSHLNPQTQEPLRGLAPGAQGAPLTLEERAEAIDAAKTLKAQPAATMPAGGLKPFCVLA
jgi:hypothetical protein